MVALGPSVVLATEGTYPYRRGGVSTWCDTLTDKLSEFDFTLLAITSHPYLAPQYTLAPNVRDMITVPLWGTEDAAEYGRHKNFAEFLKRRWSTTTQAIEDGYLPTYKRLLREIVNPTLPPRALGLSLLQLHQHFRSHDYHRTQTHLAVWETFLNVVRRAWCESYPEHPPPALAEFVDAWHLLYRLLLPLAVELPHVDMTHSVAAGFCGLPCVIQKLRWGTPYLLTEHGVYLCEQYVNLGRTTESLLVRWFLFRLISTVVDINYAFADQISPVCQYYAQWEKRRRVDPARIRVIYNGVDPLKFCSTPTPWKRLERPVIVCIGPILPLKGQLDLIDAAALVRQTMPDVEFRLYGSTSDEAYFRECQERVRTHDLVEHVIFAGSTTEPWSVFREADVVALPSIAEAFPHALVEAMLTGSAIVATDVGGVREAVAATGILVPPRDPAMLAEAIVTLLRSPQTRHSLGLQARDRAVQWFTEQRFVDAYRASYVRLLTERLALPDDEEGADTESEVVPQLDPAHVLTIV